MVEDVVDVLDTFVSDPLPVDVLLSLFCVPGRAGKSSLLIVNSVVSDAGVLMIPTVKSMILLMKKFLIRKKTYRNSIGLITKKYRRFHWDP